MVVARERSVLFTRFLTLLMIAAIVFVQSYVVSLINMSVRSTASVAVCCCKEFTNAFQTFVVKSSLVLLMESQHCFPFTNVLNFLKR